MDTIASPFRPFGCELANNTFELGTTWQVMLLYIHAAYADTGLFMTTFIFLRDWEVKCSEVFIFRIHVEC